MYSPGSFLPRIKYALFSHFIHQQHAFLHLCRDQALINVTTASVTDSCSTEEAAFAEFSNQAFCKALHVLTFLPCVRSMFRQRGRLATFIARSLRDVTWSPTLVC